MFIKRVKSKNREYVHLIESYCDEDGRTKRQVLYNFGRRGLFANEAMSHNIVRRLNEIAGSLLATGESKSLRDCSDATPLNLGYVAYAKLWKSIVIENCLQEIKRKSKAQFSLSETTLFMVLQHLLSPRSKLRASEHQSEFLGYKELKLQHLYRTLDQLSLVKERIEDALFFENYVKVDQ